MLRPGVGEVKNMHRLRPDLSNNRFFQSSIPRNLAVPPISGKIRLPFRRAWLLERPEDQVWMLEALAEARRAAEIGEVPIGAVVVRDGEVIGRGHNRREIDGDPLAHAELLALREAAARTVGWRLSGCTMYVTLEPCAMCAGALVNSRIDRLVYGAADPKAGWCGTLGNLVQDPRLNHRLEVTAGVLEAQSSALLRSFFASLRQGR
jgi:tRNA(adenine34) deaminase